MVMNGKRQVAAALVLLLVLAGSLFAEDVSFEATVDRTKVSLGASVRLNLSFYGAKDVSVSELPDIDGFNWRYLGPSRRISIVNGKSFSSVTHIYALTPLKAGTFGIPSLSVQYKGQTYTSKPILIKVVQAPLSQPLAAQQPGQQDSEARDLKDRVFLIMQVDKGKAYVNEIIPLTIKLYVNKLAIRDIQYPQFVHQGFSVDEFAEPKQYQGLLNAIAYDVIEFNTNVFGTHPGELILGPAELRCNLMIRGQRRRGSVFGGSFFSSDFFNRFSWLNYEKYPLNLKSADIPVTIMPLPPENVPADYSGAVGNYRFFVEASPKQVKVGDPITLKMTVSGRENFKTVNIPSLNFGDDFKLYDPDIRQDKETKTFEQVIIPKSDAVKEIPKIRFSFFDPKSGTYKTIVKGPIPIKVNPLARGEELRVFELPAGGKMPFRKKEILGRDIIYIKDTPGRLSRNGQFLSEDRIFIAIQFIPLLGIIFTLIFHKRRERIKTDIRYARRLRAPGEARKNLRQARRFLDLKQSDKFFDVVFKTLQEYLGDKFHLPTAGITSNIVEDFRSGKIIDERLLNMLEGCFGNCDRARYAPASITEGQMINTFELLEEIIDALEKAKV